MSKFLYDYLKPKYGDNSQLLLFDTDSLLGLIYTEDFHQDIAEDVDRHFDTSNFPKNFRIPNFAGKNKKVLDRFSSEVGANQILEFCGLRSKQYCFTTDKSSTVKCKGVSKMALRDITIEDYKKALDLTTEPIYRDMHLIRSHNHINYTEVINKKVLDGKDEKRIILSNGIDTLPYGM